MKNVEYVAGVTAIYRKYLDLYREMGEEDLSLDKTQEHRQRDWRISGEDYAALEELYSRSGFTDGYWNRHNGPEMMATVHPRNLGRTDRPGAAGAPRAESRWSLTKAWYNLASEGCPDSAAGRSRRRWR